jgi:pimeloyl-ACP methyl ester carboxylesterase
MTQTSSGHIELDGGRIFYQTAGAGETLVLCHAGFVDSRMWDDQWEELARRYRVVRFDMRGYGKSDPAPGPISRRVDLLWVLERLDIERAILVGCSLGGEIALDFALEHPEMVAALALVSAVPSGFQMQGEPPRYLFEMMGAVEAGDLERAAELQTRIWIDGSLREPEQIDPGLRQRAREMSLIALENDTWRTVDTQPLNPLNPPAAGRLAEVRAPTLIVAGNLDHPEIMRAAAALADGIAESRKEIMVDCAHLPSMEQPARFNQILLDFLAGV